MKWLRDRIFGGRPISEKTVEEQADTGPRTSETSRPRLVFLVHDAAGPAAYQLHTFEDATSGAAFIQFWFPPNLDHGALAFWAAHEEPLAQANSNEERSTEVVVLIRDEDRSDIVYPFSFPDMGLAHSWVAREAAEGLNLRSVLLYWATPAQIGTDHWGRVRITPTDPPAPRQPERPAPSVLLEALRSEVREKEPLGQGDAAQPEEADQPSEAPAVMDDITHPIPAGEETNQGHNGERAREDEVPEIVRQAERLVREKRWEQREDRFRGFGSPPGKF